MANSNYVDLVLVEFGGVRRVYEAPAFTYFDEGDMVLVEGAHDGEVGRVLKTITQERDRDVHEFILAMVGREKLARVKVMLRRKELIYEEESDEQGDADRTND